MKTAKLSLMALGIILIAAVLVSYLLVKPAFFIGHREAPVFIGNEVIVNNVAPVKASAAELIKVVPVPAPRVAAPLPIVPPSIAYSVLPLYPAQALEKGLEGAVLLSVYVGLNGATERVEVKSSSGAVEFDQSALAAVSQWKFNPASQGGAALASWFEIPVRFALN